VYAGRHGVRRDACRHSDRQRTAEHVDLTLDTEPGDVWQPFVERRHGIPELPLGASDARMASPDRPARPHVPLDDGARREAGRALAARPVQAPSPSRRFVVELLDELPGVEMSSPLTLIVDPLPVREQRPTVDIQLGDSSKREEVHDGGSHHVRDRRAARDVHDRFVAHDIGHADGAGRIRIRGLDVPPVRAGTDRDYRGGTGGRFLENLLRRASADRRVDPVVLQRHRTRHDQDVLTGVRLHRGLHRSLCGVSRCGH
jgi:hypothetical protein